MSLLSILLGLVWLLYAIGNVVRMIVGYRCGHVVSLVPFVGGLAGVVVAGDRPATRRRTMGLAPFPPRPRLGPRPVPPGSCCGHRETEILG